MSRRGWLSWAVAVGLVLCGAQAQAGIDFIEVQTTLVPLGADAAPGGQLLVSERGQVVLMTAGMDGVHVIPVELGTGGTLFVYPLGDDWVDPVSATFGPGGDLLLRASGKLEMKPVGATARLTLEGAMVWETPDAAFAETDAYVGLYEEAVGPVVWSGTRQRVLIFSRSSFQVAPVSQGTGLFEFNGEVRQPSVLFGTEYIGATLGNALRMADGQFLVYYLSQNDVGARFFVYDGLESLSQWRPEGGDWTQRIVYEVKLDPDGNLILLWNDVATSTEAGHLTKLDAEGKLLWEVALAGAIDIADPETGMQVEATMGRPSFMVTASSELVLLRRAGPSAVFDVRSTEDGSPLGFSDFFELTDRTVYDLAFLNGSAHDYVVSTVDSEDPEHNYVLQVRLLLNDDPVVVKEPDNNAVNNGATNNGPLVDDPDAGDGDRPPRPSVGCACSAGDGRPADLAGLLGLLCGVWLWRRR